MKKRNSKFRFRYILCECLRGKQRSPLGNYKSDSGMKKWCGMEMTSMEMDEIIQGEQEKCYKKQAESSTLENI